MKKLAILILILTTLTGCHSDDIDINIVYDVPSDIDITYSKGNANAPVVITEYSDYECPFCNRFKQETLPQIKENYLDTGKAILVFRDLPLSFHNPAAEQEARAKSLVPNAKKKFVIKTKTAPAN